LTNDGFAIKVHFNPLILVKVTNCKVFNNDQHIFRFLTNEDTFNDVVIYDEEHARALQYYQYGMENVNGNFIPRFFLKLEKLYIFKEHVNAKKNSSSMNHELINLGTIENPKNVNLGTWFSLTKKTYIFLCRQYMYVFAWY